MKNRFSSNNNGEYVGDEQSSSELELSEYLYSSKKLSDRQVLTLVLKKYKNLPIDGIDLDLFFKC